MIPTQQQHRQWSTLQKRWRADAMRDANSNLQRALAAKRAHNVVLARAYMLEYNWDKQWGNRRGRIAKREARLGRR